MDPFERRRVGRTALHVTALGLGGVFIAPRPNAGGPQAEEAHAVVRTALTHGVRYFDTAPLYGLGESERRYGEPLSSVPRSDIVISTKVGRVLDSESRRGFHFDFSRDGIQRSLEGSLERLGVDRVDIVYMHDPDDHWEQAIGEGFPALADLRAQGVVGAIGAGMNQWEMELRFAREGAFDCFLLAGRYTLLEQGAVREFLPYCAANGISVVAGGPYNSGVLASDGRTPATYNYRPAPPEILERVAALRAVCTRNGVPLRAAALQFILAHPAITAVVPGAGSVAEVDENVAMVRAPIPTQLWGELKDGNLLDPAAPTP